VLGYGDPRGMAVGSDGEVVGCCIQSGGGVVSRVGHASGAGRFGQKFEIEPQARFGGVVETAIEGEGEVVGWRVRVVVMW